MRNGLRLDECVMKGVYAVVCTMGHVVHRGTNVCEGYGWGRIFPDVDPLQFQGYLVSNASEIVALMGI